jgi:uncharacterized membrane protein YphA (DoxX/SURF4 family)
VTAVPMLFGTLARVVGGGAFIWSGTSKLVDSKSFELALKEFPIARLITGRARVAPVLAKIIGVLELTAGLSFLVGALMPWSGLAALFLLMSFTVGVIVAIARGEKVSCGCFGSSSNEPVGMRELVRNLGLLLTVSAGLLGDGGSLDNVIQGRVSVGEFIVLIGVATQGVLLALVCIEVFLLHRVPNFVRAVPRGEPAALDTVWEGARERRWSR